MIVSKDMAVVQIRMRANEQFNFAEGEVVSAVGYIVAIEGFEEWKFFADKRASVRVEGDEFWCVSELSTGWLICTACDSKEEAVERATHTLIRAGKDQLRAKIEAALKRFPALNQGLYRAKAHALA